MRLYIQRKEGVSRKVAIKKDNKLGLIVGDIYTKEPDDLKWADIRDLILTIRESGNNFNIIKG